MSKIEVNTVDVQCGSTLTLGSSGKTVAIACGASTSGMGRTGTVDWCTTAKTSPFSAVNGKGYFVNTTSGAITVTLPSSPSAGDIIAIKDYANTFDTNNVTIGRGGSKINGNCDDATLNTESQSVTLIYVDGTKGWQSIQDGTSDVTGSSFMAATGGTITTCGNYKIHTFTSDGTFTVTSVGSPSGSDKVSYMVIAGGGGSARDRGGGGGAGGFREGKAPAFETYTASPLVAPDGLSVPATAYPITVGAGGAADNSPPYSNGASGSNSVFSTITSAGGGGGGRNNCTPGGIAGGSGSGAGSVAPHTPRAGGAGNTPPVSPPQGNPGGAAQNVAPQYSTGGGGGAGGAGGDSSAPLGGAAGTGVTTHVSGSPVGYAGGGAGSNDSPGNQGTPAAPFGGGNASPGDGGPAATDGTANKGGGGGAGAGSSNGGSGGSGIVIIRYKFQ